MRLKAALRITLPAALYAIGVALIVVLRGDTANAQLNPTGAWNISISGSLSTTCTADFTLNGTAITAGWTCSNFGSGTLTGTLDKTGPDATFAVSGTITSQLGSANFSANGTVAQSATSMSGTWQATNYGYSGTFTGTRKEATPTATPTATSGAAMDTPQPTEAAATSTPTPVPPTPTPSALPGDGNCDGSVNSIDAAITLQYVAGLVGSLPCQGALDVNGDGTVNAIDVTLILQYVAGLLLHL